MDELKELIRERKAGGGGSGGARGAGGGKAARSRALAKHAVPMDMDTGEDGPGAGASGGRDVASVPSSDVLTLEGHENEVFTCAWSPSGDKLASGSGDSTARIWSVAGGVGGGQTEECVVLKHFNAKAGASDRDKDVTTLDWNKDGSLLATGSYDGVTRLWDTKGEQRMAHTEHKGAVFTLRFNESSDLLLSGSVDKTSVVWDVNSGKVRQQFRLHEAPVLDVAWRDDSTFATCSTDSSIYVCKVGMNEREALCSFRGANESEGNGHSNDVNAVRWDPSKKVLASCSDDCTVRLWSVEEKSCLHVLREHKKEIYTVEFAPAATVTPTLLATASFDSTVRVWDVERGSSKFCFRRHKDPVYTVEFSPDGRYLASGSFDQYVHVWSVADGSLVKSFKGTGGIFELAWHPGGERLAACFSNSRVQVLDLRLA